MPLDKSIERVQNACSLYSKVAQTVNEETLTYVFNVLLYINANMATYKKNESYTFDEEFSLLVDSLERLSAFSAPGDAANSVIESIQSNLISNLIITHDLLLERNPGSADLTKIMSLVETLPDLVLSNVYILPTSNTANYLIENGKTLGSVPVLDWKLEKKRILDLASNNYWLKRQITDIDSALQIDNSTSDEKLAKSFESLLKVYFEKKSLGLKDEDIPNLISQLAEDYEDKEKFVRIFLNNYAELYKKQSRKSDEVNAMLIGVTVFLPMLDKLLPPGQFSVLLEQQVQSETRFLYDKSAAEHDEAMAIYESCMSFYTNLSSKKYNFDNMDQGLMRGLHLPVLLDSNRLLFPHLQIAGRNTVDSIELITPSSILNKLPPIVQTELADAFKINPELQREFEKFIKLFEEVNSKADLHQQRHLGLFFFENQAAIMQLVNIMGIEGIRYLRSHIAVTVLNLERTLLSLPKLPNDLQDRLHDYCEQQHISNKNPEDLKAVITCMIILDLLKSVGDEDAAFEPPTISFELSPRENVLELARKLLGKVFQGIQVNLDEEQITAIFQRIPASKLVQLVAATKKMSYDVYREVYLNLLKLDLTGGNVEEFLHNPAQDNETGKRLAYHNALIREHLTSAEINPENAINYQRKLYFSASLKDNSATLSQDELYLVLLSYVNELKNEVNQLVLKNPSPELTRLKLQIDIIQSNYAKSNEITKGIKSAFGEINTLLIGLSNNSTQFTDKFNEFSQHTRDQYQLIKNFKTTVKKDIYHFHVEQWSKAKIDTFFLGDEVGCCLATTNSQFQAMVQRRMDDAMLFHVAVDETTGRPAALIWLYLAETSEHEIVLMANFFEVNSKYAADETLRIALLNGLLQFTHQYCQDNPKIANFYMNQLNYGWNKNDLDRYKVDEVRLSDKLGGPFIPEMPIQQAKQFHDQLSQDPSLSEQVKDHTQEKYYLVSLRQNKFHKFDPALLDLRNITITESSTLNSQASAVCRVGIFSTHEKIIDKKPESSSAPRYGNGNTAS